jgi:hypothetical protein
MPLPPVNNVSPLLAVQTPPQPHCSDRMDSQAGAAGGGVGAAFGGAVGSSAFSFDTVALQHALTRSQQLAGSAGGLRRATSAPHSMDLLGMEQQALQQQQQQNRPGYLPPTGGPMRRAASSLALRRSTSFFWTPAAHRDFERAISTLAARGAEVTAIAIMGEMGHHSDELKLADVDKHLRKKAMVQRRVLQQLDHKPGLLSPTATGHPAVPGGLPLDGIAPPHSSPASMRAGLRVPGVIAEEPAPTPALSEGLAQQFQAQRMQHMQFAAAREALVSGAQSSSSSQMPQQPPSLS